MWVEEKMGARMFVVARRLSFTLAFPIAVSQLLMLGDARVSKRPHSFDGETHGVYGIASEQGLSRLKS